MEKVLKLMAIVLNLNFFATADKEEILGNCFFVKNVEDTQTGRVITLDDETQIELVNLSKVKELAELN